MAFLFNSYLKGEDSFNLGSLCYLHGLKSMSMMNGKLCRIKEAFDQREQRYPVQVLETGDIALVKQCNLREIDKRTVFIEDIRIYPIKSCHGISLSSADVTESGLKYDRQYCIMSTLKRPKILCQISHSALAFIRSIPDEHGIRISAPGMNGSIYVRRRYEEKDRVCPKYWNYRAGISGFDQGNMASEYLTKYLCLHGHKMEKHGAVRLILLDPNFERITHDNVTSDRFTKETKRKSTVKFQNEFQFLVLSTESMDGLNTKMRLQNGYDPKKDNLKIDRFRPNLILSSNWNRPPHFEDDQLSVFEVDGIRLYHTKRADRCVIPTINQQTGVRNRKLKSMLLSYRTGKHLNYLDDPKWRDKFFFGSYFIPNTTGVIHRGAVLRMSE